MQVQAATASEFNFSKPTIWVLLTIALIVFEYILVIYFFTMRARIQVFRRTFMRQFDKEHSEAFPHLDKAPEFGYPDSGNGYYGKRLPY